MEEMAIKNISTNHLCTIEVQIVGKGDLIHGLVEIPLV